MTYDVPLPPCVEKRRHRGDSVLWGIWSHCTSVAERGACEQCDDDKWWPVWFSGRDFDGNVLPDRTPDIGTYVDQAGHDLVNRGLAPRESVMTAREIAEATSQAFLKGKR